MKLLKTILKYYLFLYISMPLTTYAYSQSNQVTTALENLLNFVTGDVAKFISMLAIVAVGFLTMAKGLIPKEKGIATCIGIGVIFAAQSLYSMFSGQ